MDGQVWLMPAFKCPSQQGIRSQAICAKQTFFFASWNTIQVCLENELFLPQVDFSLILDNQYFQMMIEEDPRGFYKLSRILFPQVYGEGSKDDSLARSIFDQAIAYARSLECIAFGQAQERIISLLTKAAIDSQYNMTSLKVKFLCQFGCAIKMTKAQRWDSIFVQIISLDKWTIGAHDHKVQRLEFINPEGQSSLFTPTIQDTTTSLDDFYRDFELKFEKVKAFLNEKARQQNRNLTDSEKVEQTCKLALSIYRKYYVTKKQIQNLETEMAEKENSFGKMITLDKSEADTAWYVVKALLLNLLGTYAGRQAQPHKFIIGFRGWILKKAIQTTKNYERIQIENFKLCLDELIFQYKQRVTRFFSKDHKNFNILVSDILNNLKEIKGGQLTLEISQGHKYEVLDIEGFTKPTLHIPENKKIDEKRISHTKIISFPTKVDRYFPFQGLDQVYEEYIKKEPKEGPREKYRLDWILLVEKTLWNITTNFANRNEIINLNIHMKQIQCQIGLSLMGQVVQNYENLLDEENKSKHAYYGMGIEGQVESHKQLVRTITAIIAFESVKICYLKELSGYRVPFQIDKLFEKFQSNSYEAQETLINLQTYFNYRKGKRIIFDMREDSQSYYEFGRKVAKKSRAAQKWIQQQKRILELKLNYQHQKAKAQICQSKINFIASIASNPQNPSQIQSIINYATQNHSHNVQLPCEQFLKNDPQLYAFANNIPKDIFGMIKMIFYAQNPSGPATFTQNNNIANVNNLWAKEEMSIKIKINKGVPKNHIFYFSTLKTPLNSQNSTNPQNKVFIYFNDRIKSDGYDNISYYKQSKNIINDSATQQQKLKIPKMLSFLAPPKKESTLNKGQMTREHQVYASLNNCPKQIDNQTFQALSNVRSGSKTQLLLLFLNIYWRKFVSDSYQDGCLYAQQLILQTGSLLSAYSKETQKHFEMIRKTIRTFIAKWKYSDPRFCPVLGPLLSCFGQRIVKDGLAGQDRQIMLNIHYQLSKKCWDEFERGQQELKIRPDMHIQWDQKFTCMAAICCFREVELQQHQQEQILFLIKLIFQLRICKILASREDRPKNKRMFEENLAFQVEKAIFRNLDTISKYLAMNLEAKQFQKLNKIIKLFDTNIPIDVEWSLWDENNPFYFKGSSKREKNAYQLDIHQGIIYKDGKEMSCLGDQIKNSPYYRQIFQQRQFQVFTKGNYLRTIKSFNHKFEIQETNGRIFFQFSQDGTQIRHIIRNQQNTKDRQVWTLVPRQLMQSSCHFPKMYLEHYLGWYNLERNCIVFRKRQFDQIYQIGIVIFLSNQSHNKNEIIAASHITYHRSFKNQNIADICDKENRKYDEIILRKKEPQLRQMALYQLLQRFEDINYMIELKDRKTQDTYVQLHRYRLKFKLDKDKKRLLSQEYFGYALVDIGNKPSQLLYSRFSCLILQKVSQNPAIMNNHKKIILISEGQIQENGKIIKKKPYFLQPIRSQEKKQQEQKLGALDHIKAYKYDIHDYFIDIRGLDRQSILHLAAIMLSLNDNILIKGIEMTPLQYSMHLMNSCFTNHPLLKKQALKLKEMIEFGNTQVVLLVESLWKTSNRLAKILPFPDLENIEDYFSKYQKLFQRCRTLYLANHSSNKIKYRQKLNKNILSFLAKISIYENIQQEVNYQEQYWKGYPRLQENQVIALCNIHQDNFKQFKDKAKQLNVWNQKFLLSNLQNFPTELKSLRNYEGQNRNTMLDEMVDAEKASFELYQKQSNRTNRIVDSLTPTKKNEQLMLVEQLKKEANNNLINIERTLHDFKEQSKLNPDTVSGVRPIMSPTFYTSILCENNRIFQYFPLMSKNAAEKLKVIIKLWMEFKIRISSLNRLQFELRQDHIDSVAIMREILSPRQQIFKDNVWLCFEAETKMQTWLSQYNMYYHLITAKNGSFCQLNMGEGKTQVIIPLMILHALFSSEKKLIPRINLLSSLFEEARSNFFRFLSVTGFQIPSFEVPFNRSVKLVKNDINFFKGLINCFSGKTYILATRQSRLSEALRFHEGKIIHQKLKQDKQKEALWSSLKQQQKNKLKQQLFGEKCKARDPSFKFDFDEEDCKIPLIQDKIFDIFDEIDALMTCKKSYIFSIGGHREIQEGNLRFQTSRLCIEVFLRQLLKNLMDRQQAVTDEKPGEAIKIVEKGQYPRGLRLTQARNDEQRKKMRQRIARQIIIESNRSEYAFIKSFAFSRQIKNMLINYVIDPTAQLQTDIQKILKRNGAINPIYLLRGLLASGIFEHCLSMRCGVDFGVPNSFHKKRIAVPYQAAQTPSKTSQYQQTDVEILLSLIAHISKGLDIKSFVQCLNALNEQEDAAKIAQYNEWVEILDKDMRTNLKLKTAQEINFSSQIHQDVLFQLFRKNRRVISFWLNKCVFPRDLKEYSQSICTSAWDIANVACSVGFSGTKDNRILFPNNLFYTPCPDPNILGTDGKMMHLLMKFTNQVSLIKDNVCPLWQRFVNQSMQKEVDCIIDAGAIFAGISLEKVIVPWIAQHRMFNNRVNTTTSQIEERKQVEKFMGISYCDIDGRWFVYDIEGKHSVRRGTTIPDHKTFAIFDQARTRGADLKLSKNIVSALSLGPNLTYDDLKQAAGRMRRLGRDQSLIIMATKQIFCKLSDQFPRQNQALQLMIEEYNANSKETLPIMVIKWCILNSAKANHDLMIPFVELGLNHIYSKKYEKAYIKDLASELSLESMYSRPFEQSQIVYIGNRIINQNQQRLATEPASQFILDILQKYGANVIKKSSNLNSCCERQVEKENAKEVEIQNDTVNLAPVSQTQQSTLLIQIKGVPFRFSQNFKMTNNLIYTTISQTEPAQIPQLYFIKVKDKDIIAMSIRQASIFIQEHIINQNTTDQRLFLLSQIDMQREFRTLELQSAFVSAKFMAGFASFVSAEEDVLMEIVKANKQKPECEQHRYSDLPKIFLKRKRTYLKKFKGSSLEKIIIRILNEKSDNF